MSSRRPVGRSTRRGAISAHALFTLCLFLVSSSVGCWEQWSEAWFPQMKWQKAVQAFERVQFTGTDEVPQTEGFIPPEGTMPINGEAARLPQYDPGVDALVNPTDPANFKSIARGQEIYEVYCTTCHGEKGMGDGPVSYAGEIQGPFAGVFPLVTAMGRSDGYLYNLIRAGGTRMPGYARIPAEDRWHVVNYTRYLQKGGQP